MKVRLARAGFFAAARRILEAVGETRGGDMGLEHDAGFVRMTFASRAAALASKATLVEVAAGPVTFSLESIPGPLLPLRKRRVFGVDERPTPPRAKRFFDAGFALTSERLGVARFEREVSDEDEALALAKALSRRLLPGMRLVIPRFAAAPSFARRRA